MTKDNHIRIRKYEQAADEKVSLNGIKWLRKWDVCVQCDSAEEAEALRARLAQPEPEPVAWISHNAGLYHGKPDESLNPLPLYTVPPQRKEWVGLTREELEEISEFHFHGALSGREFYDDVEAKLKEKNI